MKSAEMNGCSTKNRTMTSPQKKESSPWCSAVHAEALSEPLLCDGYLCQLLER
jgi:hypothetical protein